MNLYGYVFKVLSLKTNEHHVIILTEWKQYFSVAAINRDYYRGPNEGVMDIIRGKGLRGMYRGFVSQMYRDIPASVSYFTIFEFSSYYGHRHLPALNSQFLTFIAGGLAGVLSWTLILPLDVIKSRVQADVKGNLYLGLWDCAVKSVKSEGIKVLFRGYSAVALRAFLVNSVTLLVYVEMLKAYKHGIGQDDDAQQSVKV